MWRTGPMIGKLKNKAGKWESLILSISGQTDLVLENSKGGERVISHKRRRPYLISFIRFQLWRALFCLLVLGKPIYTLKSMNYGLFFLSFSLLSGGCILRWWIFLKANERRRFGDSKALCFYCNIIRTCPSTPYFIVLMLYFMVLFNLC